MSLNQNWGDGLLEVPKQIQKIPVYAENGQQAIGYIESPYWRLTIKDGTSWREITSTWANSISSNHFPTFSAGSIRGAYRLLWSTLISAEDKKMHPVLQKPLVVKSTDLEKLNVKRRPYCYFLEPDYRKNNHAARYAKLGVNLIQSCLTIRNEPSLEGSKIACAPGNDWSHSPTVSTLGLETVVNIIKILPDKDWAKVEVKIQSIDKPGDCDDCCPKMKTDKKHIGWVRLIDDNGFPNLWYSS